MPSSRHLDSGPGMMTVKMIVCHQKTIVSHPPTKCPQLPNQLVARCEGVTLGCRMSLVVT